MKRLEAICAALLLVFPVSASGEPKLVERNLLGGALTILVPTGFVAMQDEIIRVKYPGENRPAIVFTNPETTVNLALSHSPAPLAPGDLDRALDGMVEHLRAIPNGSVNYSGVILNGDREWFLIDYWSAAIDTEIRNFIVGTSFRGKLLLITFNCTRATESEWASVAKRIVTSAKLVE